jgi:hypothetical protein
LQEHATAKATADFSTAAAKCAAFGRNDEVWGREQTMTTATAKATADFSAALLTIRL